MSYRIRYDREKNRASLWNRFQLPFAILVILLALINGVYAIKDNLPELRHRLMPWTRMDVQKAYVTFCDDLTEGKPLSDCLETFCEAILQPVGEDAQEPD